MRRVGGVGREGRRKKLAWWSEGESEKIGESVFRRNRLPIPLIGSPFSCIRRKKVAKKQFHRKLLHQIYEN